MRGCLGFIVMVIMGIVLFASCFGGSSSTPEPASNNAPGVTQQEYDQVSDCLAQSKTTGEMSDECLVLGGQLYERGYRG